MKTYGYGKWASKLTRAADLLELVQEWCAPEFGRASDIATQTARWGADQELEACVEWLEQNCGRWDLPAAFSPLA